MFLGTKKYQQAFLAPLPGMDLKPPYLVIALRNANSTYKETLHQLLSEVTTFKIKKRHSFLINFVTLFIHQVYNNKDLSATIVIMTKTLALFFSTNSVVLFSE